MRSIHKVRTRENRRHQRHLRVRHKVSGSAGRPRLVVFRSSKHIYAQLVDDTRGVTLVGAADRSEGVTVEGKGKAARRLALPLDRDPLRPVRRSHERDASRVVYELGVDVFRGAEHDEPRPPRRARHLVAYPQMPRVTAVLARPDLVDRSHGLFGRLSGLAGLAPDLLAHVADPLALVRFGGPDGAELSRHLPHELL